MGVNEYKRVLFNIQNNKIQFPKPNQKKTTFFRTLLGLAPRGFSCEFYRTRTHSIKLSLSLSRITGGAYEKDMQNCVEQNSHELVFTVKETRHRRALRSRKL